MRKFILRLASIIGTFLILITGVLTTVASAATTSVSDGITNLNPTGLHSVCPRHEVTILGHLCAVPVHAPSGAPAYPPNTVMIEDYVYSAYGITMETYNHDGRLANHLYMWADSNKWSTQRWTVSQGRYGYIFKSQYDGSSGGVAYGCINVPGSTKSAGIQLIAYSCAGQPQNEQFNVVSDPNCNYLCYDMSASYDPSGSVWVSIGNNFPGNGAWVITYNYIPGDLEQQWTNDNL